MEREVLVMDSNNESQLIYASISNPGFVCLFRMDPHTIVSIHAERAPRM
jgi:hypothetical protein